MQELVSSTFWSLDQTAWTAVACIIGAASTVVAAFTASAAFNNAQAANATAEDSRQLRIDAYMCRLVTAVIPNVGPPGASTSRLVIRNVGQSTALDVAVILRGIESMLQEGSDLKRYVEWITPDGNLEIDLASNLQHVVTNDNTQPRITVTYSDALLHERRKEVSLTVRRDAHELSQ